MTNAAGGLNSEYAVGDIVLLNDVCSIYFSTFFPTLILLLHSTFSLLVWQERTHYEARMQKNSALAFLLCQMLMTSNFVVMYIKPGKA